MIWPDRLAWSVALRSLAGSRRLTALTTVVVSVSVILVVFLSSLIEGLRLDLVAETTGAIAHIEIAPSPRKPPRPAELWTEDVAYVGHRANWSRQQARIEDWRTWVRYAERFGPEVTAVSPTAQGQGFAANGADEAAVRIYGVEPRRYDAITHIEDRLREGRFFRLGPGEVAIGYKLAEDLGLSRGDRLRVTTAQGNAVDKRVAGIYDTGFGALDGSAVFMLLGDGQSLFGIGSSVTHIGLTVQDVFDAPDVAARMQRQVPHEVRPWTEDNKRLLDALEAQKRSSDMITAFAAIAAAFAVASILIVLVTNKIREIGILKAMGATRRQIRNIFAIQGTVLAGLGAILGAGLGAGFVELLSRVEVQGSDGRLSPLFPFSLSAELLIATILVSALLGLLASLVPARRASRVDPIEVIRG